MHAPTPAHIANLDIDDYECAYLHQVLTLVIMHVRVCNEAHPDMALVSPPEPACLPYLRIIAFSSPTTDGFREIPGTLDVCMPAAARTRAHARHTDVGVLGGVVITMGYRWKGWALGAKVILAAEGVVAWHQNRYVSSRVTLISKAQCMGSKANLNSMSQSQELLLTMEFAHCARLENSSLPITPRVAFQ